MAVIKIFLLLWLASGVATAVVGLVWTCRESARRLRTGNQRWVVQ